MVTTGADRAAGRGYPVLATKVVGRDPELSALREAVELAQGGKGQAVFLVGEPGIGKSRLARAVADHATTRGMPVLRGRAVAASTPLAYRPLAEALCAGVRGDVVADDDPDLEPFRPILGWLVPEWRADQARVEDSVMALAEAVLRFLRVAAARPGCLVVFEDLQWADPETLRIIEYLADNLATERVLCVATVRDEGRSAGLELSQALHARRVSRLFQLSRLEPNDVATMARSCLGAELLPDDVLELAARADGIPFLVEELLAAAVSSGALVSQSGSWVRSPAPEPLVPLTFSESMRRRLTTLGADVREVLAAAAVLGRRFDWALLPAIASMNDEAILSSLRAAVESQILAVDGADATFRFRHALSRDAVLAELLPPERTALSRRALEAVEAAHPALEDEWCELAAELAQGAGELPRSGALLLQAGRRSLERGGLASAEAALERARALLAPDDPVALDVAEQLCEALSLAGKRERAVEVGGTLLATLEGTEGSAHRRASVHLTLARAALAATQWDEAHDLLKQAAREEAQAPDERLAGKINAVRAQIAIMRDQKRAAGLANAALEAAERLDLPEVACEALEVLGRSQRPRDLEAAEATFARALAVAEAHGLTVWRTRALHELGTIDLLRGGAIDRLEEARKLAVAQGALATAAVVDVQMAAALAVRDDPEPAVAAARRAAELSRRYGLKATLAAAVALEAHAHARAGRAAEMRHCILQAHSLTPGSPDVEIKTSFAAAFLSLRADDLGEARRHLTASVRYASTGPGAGLLALLLELAGDRDELREALAAERPVHFLARAFQQYAEAVAAGRTGDQRRALALVAEGDRTLGEHTWLRQLGRRLLAEAALGHGWGEPVPWLREAVAFFDAHGEEQLASACRSLLRRAGVTIRRSADAAALPEALRGTGITARELEVLRLLALGLPNKEIAARLYLSPRTVERHIANIAVKVDVSGRSQLVALAARVLGARGPEEAGT